MHSLAVHCLASKGLLASPCIPHYVRSPGRSCRRLRLLVILVEHTTHYVLCINHNTFSSQATLDPSIPPSGGPDRRVGSMSLLEPKAGHFFVLGGYMKIWLTMLGVGIGQNMSRGVPELANQFAFQMIIVGIALLALAKFVSDRKILQKAWGPAVVIIMSVCMWFLSGFFTDVFISRHVSKSSPENIQQQTAQVFEKRRDMKPFSRYR